MISLKSSLSSPDKKNVFQTQYMKFFVGQWVDVKDTIDQWLEAQIAKISDSKAFIHYNGWGSRWDEWIDLNSPRIAMFRTHTIQLPTSKYNSPCPNIKPDADNHEIPIQNTTLAETMGETSKDIMATGEMLENLIQLCKLTEAKIDPLMINKKQKLAAQLAPIMDRLGRIMLDLSPHIHAISENNEDHNEEEKIPPPETRETQIPLIANSGDVAAVTNIMDRLLFSETPSIELHVHALLNGANSTIHSNINPSNPIPAPTNLNPLNLFASPQNNTHSVEIQAEEPIPLPPPPIQKNEIASQTEQKIYQEISTNTDKLPENITEGVQTCQPYTSFYDIQKMESCGMTPNKLELTHSKLELPSAKEPISAEKTRSNFTRRVTMNLKQNSKSPSIIGKSKLPIKRTIIRDSPNIYKGNSKMTERNNPIIMPKLCKP